MNFTPLFESPELLSMDNALPFAIFVLGLAFLVGGAVFSFVERDFPVLPLMIGCLLVGMGTVSFSLVDEQRQSEVTELNSPLVKANITTKYDLEMESIAYEAEEPLDGAGSYVVNVENGSSVMDLTVKFDETGEPTIVAGGDLSASEIDDLVRSPDVETEVGNE